MTGTVEVARRVGATFRQVDYWVRCGYLTDDGSLPVTAGSGYDRVFTPSEEERLDLLCRMIAAGIRPSRAAVYARWMVAHQDRTVGLPSGVRITVEAPT